MQDVETTYFDRLREEGLLLGKRDGLKRLLAAKFGPLPTAIEARIDAIDSADELDRYFDRALAAGSLDETGLRG